MGMYTQLNINVVFKEDTPTEIIEALTWMASAEEAQGDMPRLDHPLFQGETARVSWMLKSCGSYYFAGEPYLIWTCDPIMNQWVLTVCTDIKNYDLEWERFLDFIAPYVECYEGGKFIGTYRYEEENAPTLLYAVGGVIKSQGCHYPSDFKCLPTVTGSSAIGESA